MNIFILASSILIASSVAMALTRQKRRSQNQEKTFWAREQAANSVRRKSLDSLNYIHIPFDELPLDVMTDDSRIIEYHNLLKDLSAQPIVNLTGYSNTDLKLEYGTANITLLSEYDQNYTILVRTLQQWADILYDADYQTEACRLMEFAVSTKTDISRTYYKLADIYASRGDIFQIEHLIKQAEELHSFYGKAIVRTLRESYL